MKQLVKRVAINAGVVRLFEQMSDTQVPILTLHRFAAEGGRGAHGAHSIAALRRNLEYLRQRNFTVLSLDTLVEQMTEGRRSFRRSVAFTVDDGYADFHNLALPVFAEFDCPVTVFLATGPLDGGCWLWWDRLDFAMRATCRTALDLVVDGAQWHLTWEGVGERQGVVEHLWERLKRVSAEVRERAIEQVIGALEVDLPTVVPADYAPMTWDQVRDCERSGVARFGPHTVTHPILATVSDARATDEIATSWRRVKEECAAPLPIFAYPNGTADAYGLRDVEIVNRLGFMAAVTTEPRYVSHRDFDTSAFPLARFAVPRLPCFEQHDDFRQAVHGVEYVKWRARGRPTQGHPAAWSAGSG